MNSFAFLNTHLILVTLLLFLITVGTILFGARLHRSRLERLGVSVKEFSSRTSSVAVLLVSLMCCIALLRPTFGFNEITVAGQSLKHILLIDISRSMLVADQKPNRLQHVKRKVIQLLDLLEQQEQQHAVGIVIFSGSAHTYLPTTTDYEVIKTMVRALDNNLIAQQGSALKSAITLALRLAAAEDQLLSPQLILFSDGEDRSLSLDDIRSLHQQQAFNLHTLGFGTLQGAPIPIGNGRFMKDSAQSIVISRQDAQQLRQLAEIGNGRYYNSSLDNRDVRLLVDSIASIHSRASERVLRTYNEYYFYFGIVALALLTAASWIRLPHVIFILALSVCPARVIGESGSNLTDYAATKAYKNGQFEIAEKHFRQRLSEDPENADYLQALGSALYKQENFKEAERMFKGQLENAESANGKFFAHYNLGNTLFHQKKFIESIEQYEEALEIKPDDIPSSENLELAKKMLQQQQQEEKEQQEQEQEQNQDKDQEQQQDQQSQSQQQEQGQSSEQEDSQQQEQDTEQPQDSPQEQEQEQQNQEQTQEDKPQEEQNQEREGQSSPEENSNDAEQDGDSNSEQQEQTDQLDQQQEKPIDEQAEDYKAAQRWLEAMGDTPIRPRSFSKHGENRYNQQQW